MRLSEKVTISGRQVGPGRPCYLIAEVGINHNGDLDLALRAIAVAAECGADAVKFQNYRTEDFVSDTSLTIRYSSRCGQVEESQYALFKRCEMRRDWLPRLKQAADAAGIGFISTPTSTAGVDALAAFGAAAVKNGSDYLGNLPLIRDMARSGLPTILSAGMASASDVSDAVEAFAEAGGQQLVLLHCVSIYPAPAAELNLRKMATLAATFGVPVGFSDHSCGVVGAAVAAALGASMIEKHFTLDRSLPGPDHAMSSDPAEFKALVAAVRDAEAALGSGLLQPAAGEAGSRSGYTLSCVAAGDLEKGYRLTELDVAFRRPGTGLRPAFAPGLAGRQLKEGVRRGHIFAWTDFA